MNITNRITSATFSVCITNKDGLPKDDLPIIALVGRSNVGKSSLINSLTGRKELARTSSMPGKTLTMNFYCINDAFYLVDLPGYGYAKASKATRNKIQAMMDEFFTSCNNLKGVVQIIDIRHKPSALDMQMHNWLKEQRFNGFTVLTKADKLSNQQVIKMHSVISKEIRGSYIMCYSSKTASGRDEFLDAVEKIIGGFAFKVTESRNQQNTSFDKNDDYGKASEKLNTESSNVARPKMTGETPGHQKKVKVSEDFRNRSDSKEHRRNGIVEGKDNRNSQRDGLAYNRDGKSGNQSRNRKSGFKKYRKSDVNSSRV